MEPNNLVIMAIGLLFVLNVVPGGHKVYRQRMRLNFGMKGIMTMDDLISREKAIEAVKVSDYGCNNPSERIGIIFARVEARRAIQSIPTIPAVPLDKLCEFLGEATNPCILLAIGCPYSESNCEECDSCNAWKAALTNWMEEQNV